MYLTEIQTLIIILCVALGTIFTRFLPFIIFPDNKPVPAYITYLGKVLPPAVIGLLVVYCLKNVSVTTNPYGLPEFIAIVGIIILHKWKHSTLLSIAGGTGIYLLLIQTIMP